MKIYRGVDAMRALPIFKPEMRKANRDGLKSITRRVMDPQPISTTGFWKGLHWANESHFRKGAVELCNYGKVGDVVYMREPLVQVGAWAFYKDDNRPVISLITGEMVKWRWQVKTLSGMFMPGEAARFIYRYESIRVERVQEITRDDAKAEGVRGVWVNPPANEDHYQRVMLNPYVANYSVLWDEINGERGFGWDVNPWVWVLEYKVVETPSALSGTSPILEERQNGGGKEVDPVAWQRERMGEWKVNDEQN